MKLKTLLAAVLAPVILLAGCSSDNGTNNSAKYDIEPAEIVNAVLAEVPVSSGVEKNKNDITDFYSGIDETQVESAAFVICGSGAYPDEIAVMKCTDSSAAASVKAGLEKRLASQIELYSTYTPDEMYKLETAEVYTAGNYAILLALSDNSKAKEIVDGKFSG